MTNLEYYKNELELGSIFCVNAHICKYGKKCHYNSCTDCEFYGVSADECIKVMLAEHKELVKLKQLEKDLIAYRRTSRASFEKMTFVQYPELMYLKGIGHFKGVPSIYMELNEILENCEVVE